MARTHTTAGPAAVGRYSNVAPRRRPRADWCRTGGAGLVDRWRSGCAEAFRPGLRLDDGADTRAAGRGSAEVTARSAPDGAGAVERTQVFPRDGRPPRG